jgi:hypothetical protein
MFRAGPRDEIIPRPDETIFLFWRRSPETAVGYQITNKTAGTPAANTGDSQMRTISFILAFAFLMAGPTMAGSVDNLPGVGTFAYNGAPIAGAAPMLVAAK